MKKNFRKLACVLALALAMVSVFGVAFADESKTYNIGIIQLIQHRINKFVMQLVRI